MSRERDDPGVRRPSQERARDTMERIVGAAYALLQDREWDEVTVDEIVERAGSSKGAFYYRFDDKEALLRLLHGRTFDEAIDAWAGFMDTARWEDEGLEAFVQAFVDRVVRIYTRSGPLMRALIFHVRWGDDPVLRERTRRLNAHVREGFARVLEAKRGRLAHDDPTRAAELATGLAAGLLQQRLLFPEAGAAVGEAERAELTREVARALTEYLTA